MIDTTYVCGRDNYQCQIFCNNSLTAEELKYPFVKLDPDGENITANLVLSCSGCKDFEAFQRRKHETLRFDKRPFSGRLIVITGPMFAEKSSTAKSLINKYEVVRKTHIWVKPDTDNRKTNYTTTHNDEQIEAHTISAKRPDLHLDELLSHEIVVLDEVQFYSERIIYVVHQLLKNGCMVIANGLKLTASQNLFGFTHYLLGEADDIISLKAVCNVCANIDIATRTKPYEKIPTVRIGGNDCYYAICPPCDGSKYEEEFLRKAADPKLRLGE